MRKEITVKLFYVKATIDEKLDKIVYVKKNTNPCWAHVCYETYLDTKIVYVFFAI